MQKPRPSGSHRARRVRSHADILLEELTVERQTYAVKLSSTSETITAWRQGNKWYDSDGRAVADSADIAAVQVPARWS